jgi:ABC-type phosphate/phosphonate transport system substrate-binding protein
MEEFRRAASKELGREVHFELTFPLLLEPQLGVGWQQFAIVSPAHYAALAKPDEFPVVAVGGAAAEQPCRPAYFVAPANSAIRELRDARNELIAFGPAEDSRLFLAAALALDEVGISRGDLKRQIIPVPGSLMHHRNSADATKAVLDGAAGVAVVDSLWFDALPEASPDSMTPSKSRLRVIARTIALPDRVILRSPKIEPGLDLRMREFLLAAHTRHPTAMQRLKIGAFAEPAADCTRDLQSLKRMQELFPARPAQRAE